MASHTNPGFQLLLKLGRVSGAGHLPTWPQSAAFSGSCLPSLACARQSAAFPPRGFRVPACVYTCPPLPKCLMQAFGLEIVLYSPVLCDLLCPRRGCCCCSVASVVSDSVGPHKWQPTRLPHPWDSPGKNTGVGCYFLLQCLTSVCFTDQQYYFKLLLFTNA